MESNTDFIVPSKLDVSLRRTATEHLRRSKAFRTRSLENLQTNGQLLGPDSFTPDFDPPNIRPVPGELISVEYPDWNMVDYAPLATEEYETSNGHPAGYYQYVREFDPLRHEANIGLAVGKWFNRKMIPFDAEGANPVATISSYCYGALNGIDTSEDKYVKLKIKLSFPTNPDAMFYATRGNSGIQQASLQLSAVYGLQYVPVSLRTYRNQDDIILAQVADDANSGYSASLPPASLTLSRLVYVPRGSKKIEWVFYMTGIVGCSPDLLLLDDSRTDQYAAAVIDLRHSPKHNAYGLIIDPFDHLVPPPPGGVYIDVTAEVYDAV